MAGSPPFYRKCGGGDKPLCRPRPPEAPAALACLVARDRHLVLLLDNVRAGRVLQPIGGLQGGCFVALLLRQQGRGPVAQSVRAHP